MIKNYERSFQTHNENSAKNQMLISFVPQQRRFVHFSDYESPILLSISFNLKCFKKARHSFMSTHIVYKYILF